MASDLREAGVKRAILMVDLDNDDGKAFWGKCGFEKIEADAYGITL